MRLSQRLIAAAVLVALSGALAGCGGGGLSSWIRPICWISSTPRKSCRASASRFSPRAFPASSRACRRSCTKVPPRSSSISRTPQPPLRLSRRPRKSRNRLRNPGARRASRRRRPAPLLRQHQGPPLRPIPMLRPRERTPRLPRHRRPSRRKSFASAPPRHRRISRPCSPPRLRNNNPPHRSRRRCRAITSSADLFIALTRTPVQSLARSIRAIGANLIAEQNRSTLLRNDAPERAGILYVFYHCHYRPAQCR